jgi:hypothetical protein
MFELASKIKLRFQYKGIIGVEDLWDLQLIDLNEIAKKVNRQLKNLDDEDFISGDVKVTKEKENLQLQLDILKHIIAIKIEDRELKLKARERLEKRKHLQELIYDKQNKELSEKSLDELVKMLNEVDENLINS